MVILASNDEQKSRSASRSGRKATLIYIGITILAIVVTGYLMVTTPTP